VILGSTDQVLADQGTLDIVAPSLARAAAALRPPVALLAEAQGPTIILLPAATPASRVSIVLGKGGVTQGATQGATLGAGQETLAGAL